jgi:hypothetical protein
MRIIIEIDEGSAGNSPSATKAAPTVHIDGGRPPIRLSSTAVAGEHAARLGTDGGGMRVRREGLSEVSHAHNPLRAGAAIERRLAAQSNLRDTGRTDAGRPAHTSERSHESRHRADERGRDTRNKNDKK